jgi:hypothetical protein
MTLQACLYPNDGREILVLIAQTPPEELEADELLPHVRAIPERCQAAFASFMAACLVWMAGEEGDEEMDEGEISFAEHGRLAHAYRCVPFSSWTAAHHCGVTGMPKWADVEQHAERSVRLGNTGPHCLSQSIVRSDGQ